MTSCIKLKQENDKKIKKIILLFFIKTSSVSINSTSRDKKN